MLASSPGLSLCVCTCICVVCDVCLRIYVFECLCVQREREGGREGGRERERIRKGSGQRREQDLHTTHTYTCSVPVMHEVLCKHVHK